MDKQDKTENNSSQNGKNNTDPHAFEKQYSLARLKATSVYDDLIYKIGASKSGVWNVDSLKNYINTVYLLNLNERKLKVTEHYVIFNTGLHIPECKDNDNVYCIAENDDENGLYRFLSFSTEDEILEKYKEDGELKLNELPLPKDVVLNNKKNHDELKLPGYDEEAFTKEVERIIKGIREINNKEKKNSKEETEDEKFLNVSPGWPHIIIDGCDNLPHSLFRYIIDSYVEEKDCNKYRNLLFKIDNQNDTTLKELQENLNKETDKECRTKLINQLQEERKKIILSRCITIKERIQKAFFQSIEKKEVIAPFYYLNGKDKGKRTNYALPLYIGHDKKPDCVIVFDHEGNAKTLLNMREIRRNTKILDTDLILEIPWLRE